MEADAFLDDFIEQVDKVSATDGDYGSLRNERLSDLNEVCIDLVHSFDFSWLARSTTVTVSASASSAALASDFYNIGGKGGVWRTVDGEPLTYKDPDYILWLRLQPGNRPTRPEFYSIFDSSSGLQLIQTETLGAACSLTYLYRRVFPALTDAANGSFLVMPEVHQRTAVWMGMTAKKNGEDFRTNAAYIASKQSAAASDQKGKEQGGQLASFFGD